MKPNLQPKTGLTLNAELVALGFACLGLKTSGERDFPLSLDSLFQCSTALTAKNFFMSCRKIPCLNLCSCQEAPKRVWFCLLNNLLWRTGELLLDPSDTFSSPARKNPITSTSLHSTSVLQPLTILAVLHWTSSIS